MSHDWLQRATAYLDELETVVATVTEILESSRIDTVAANPSPAVGADQLSQSLQRLEILIADRETLLADEDAPADGHTLTEKITTIQGDVAAQARSRCERLAAKISTANQSAVSLFVCQYHLASFSGEVIRMLAGGDPPATYDNSGNTTVAGGGQLFNEAA